MRDRTDDHTHRQVAATKLGRPLKPSEVVDHLDEDKANNAPANLQVVPRGAHTAKHNRQRRLSKLRGALRMVKEKRKVY